MNDVEKGMLHVETNIEESNGSVKIQRNIWQKWIDDLAGDEL